MAQVAYVNGRLIPRAEAVVSIDDHGLLFADSVYEVILVAGGRPVDMAGHLARLQRSMAALMFQNVPGSSELEQMIVTLIRDNAVGDGMAYLQVGRGTAPREMTPGPNLVPSVIATTHPHVIPAGVDPARAIDVATMPDLRWGRCDIKTTSLVAGIIALLGARAQGCGDAWLVDRGGFITEGCASNAWIVRDGTIITRPAGPEILAGITRARVMQLAAICGIRVVEEKFDVSGCQHADEAFLTSATALVTAVRAIDGAPIGRGAPGPVTDRLHRAYVAFARDAGT